MNPNQVRCLHAASVLLISFCQPIVISAMQGAWGGQPPAGINPFSQPPPPVNPYGHFSSEVNTTYVPHAEGTVPSVMPPVSTAATAAAPSAPAGGPAAGPPGHPGSKFPFKLPFTSRCPGRANVVQLTTMSWFAWSCMLVRRCLNMHDMHDALVHACRHAG